MTLTRKEREQRRKRDTNDAEETVHYSIRGQLSIKRAYHDDGDCQKISFADNEISTASRHFAKAQGWYPCTVCVLGDTPPNTGGLSKLEVLINEGKVPEEHLGSPLSD